MLNETLWASGMATLSQCYSIRGINVVAAHNISQTFFNVFSVAFMAVGIAIGILLGQMLGAGKTEEVKSASLRLSFFSVFVSVVIAVVYFFAAEFIPEAYNTENNVRSIATALMQITAITMPLDAYAHASYFTLRSGGKTAVTFIFDSGFMWVIAVPIVFILSRFTSLSVLYLYTICQSLNFLKCLIGFYFVKKGSWIKNIIEN